MFKIFKNDDKKKYFVCISQAEADAQGGTWEMVSDRFSSFDMALFTAQKFSSINTGFTACGGYVVAAPAQE